MESIKQARSRFPHSYSACRVKNTLSEERNSILVKTLLNMSISGQNEVKILLNVSYEAKMRSKLYKMWWGTMWVYEAKHFKASPFLKSQSSYLRLRKSVFLGDWIYCMLWSNGSYACIYQVKHSDIQTFAQSNIQTFRSFLFCQSCWLLSDLKQYYQVVVSIMLSTFRRFFPNLLFPSCYLPSLCIKALLNNICTCFISNARYPLFTLLKC